MRQQPVLDLEARFMGIVTATRPVAGPAYYDFIASRGLPTQMAEVRCVGRCSGEAVQRWSRGRQQWKAGQLLLVWLFLPRPLGQHSCPPLAAHLT